MKKLTLLIVASVGVVGLLGLYNMTNPSVANAATTANSKLSQTINPGVLSTDIRDSANSLVNNPTFAMGATTVSTSSHYLRHLGFRHKFDCRYPQKHQFPILMRMTLS